MSIRLVIDLLVYLTIREPNWTIRCVNSWTHILIRWIERCLFRCNLLFHRSLAKTMRFFVFINSNSNGNFSPSSLIQCSTSNSSMKNREKKWRNVSLFGFNTFTFDQRFSYGIDILLWVDLRRMNYSLLILWISSVSDRFFIGLTYWCEYFQLTNK